LFCDQLFGITVVAKAQSALRSIGLSRQRTQVLIICSWVEPWTSSFTQHCSLFHSVVWTSTWS